MDILAKYCPDINDHPLDKDVLGIIFSEYLEEIKKTYHKDGSLRSKVRYFDGKREGERTEYHPDGCLASKCFYVNNLREGEYKSYNIDRKPFVECFYVNGKKHGEYKEYYGNGNLHIQCFYVNGTQHGLYKQFHYNENLHIQVFYEDGVKEEEFEEFHYNGKLYISCFYLNGKKEGKQETYNDEGKKIGTINYENDLVVSPTYSPMYHADLSMSSERKEDHIYTAPRYPVKSNPSSDDSKENHIATNSFVNIVNMITSRRYTKNRNSKTKL